MTRDVGMPELATTTNMHRQISMPRRQMEFLAARARRESVSVAKLIHQMVENEAHAAELGPQDIDSDLSFAGLVANVGNVEKLHALLAVSSVCRYNWACSGVGQSFT